MMVYGSRGENMRYSRQMLRQTGEPSVPFQPDVTSEIRFPLRLCTSAKNCSVSETGETDSGRGSPADNEDSSVMAAEGHLRH